jgi:hypothetical protein
MRGAGVSGLAIRYQPPGPVAARFMASDASVRCINGPIGSGKTGACLMDGVFRAARQAPDANGVRRFKGAVIRDTYRQLEKTTIPSWHRWVPKETGDWIGGEGGRPAVHRLRFGLPDGTMVDLVMEFLGLGEHKVEDAMRGWEGTWAYLNEADLLAKDVLTFVRGRVGRYPAKDGAGGGGASWYGVVLDCNAPDTDSWIYHDFVEAPAKGWEWFRQPGGRDAGAENLRNLPDGYYEQQVQGQPDWYVRRFVDNLFGYSRDGLPVYPEFNDAFHVAPKPLEPLPGVALTLGLDAGLSPAAIVTQRAPDGQWRILDELVGANMGATRFGELLLQLLAEKYAKLKATAWADPASMSRSSTDERSWAEVIAATTKLAIAPTMTNAISVRLDAVRVPLTRMIDGHKPGLLLSPSCKVLRKGFNSGYAFRRLQLAGQSRFEELPAKNDFSHPHDGLQYALLGGGEHRRLLGQKEGRFGRKLEYPALGVA